MEYPVEYAGRKSVVGVASDGADAFAGDVEGFVTVREIQDFLRPAVQFIAMKI